MLMRSDLTEVVAKSSRVVLFFLRGTSYVITFVEMQCYRSAAFSTVRFAES